MSQQKVDRYKQSKANRQQLIKKEKMVHRFEMIAVAVVVVGILGWFGTSVYTRIQESAPATEYVLDISSVEGYLNGLHAAVEE